MTLAEQCLGRMIHITLDVFLRTPVSPDLGDTDPAWEIGKQVGRESAQAIKTQCEAAGFAVEVDIRQVVY